MRGKLNGNFRDIVVKHSRWKKLQYKKAEAEAVFNATKKFEEHTFYEHCLKMPNIYEQLLNGKTTSPEPSQSFYRLNLQCFVILNWRLHATKKLETCSLMKIINF